MPKTELGRAKGMIWLEGVRRSKSDDLKPGQSLRFERDDNERNTINKKP